MISLLHFKDTYLPLFPPYLTCASALNPRPSSTALPDDILNLICHTYVDSVLREAKTIWDFRKKRDEYWSFIVPLAKTSTHLRRIVIGIWQTTWATCYALQCLSHTRCRGSSLPLGIRILTLSDEWEPNAFDLTPLTELQCLSIGYHNLLRYDSSQHSFRILTGVNMFPSSLRRLEILHFHGSTQRLVSLIESCCSRLVELRLVRCTMFEDPGCKWWRINNHTDYLVGHHEDNVRDHATILGKYIEGLVYLEQLYINSFFINLDSVFRHRLEHRQYHPRGHHDRTNPVDGVMMHNALHLAALAPEGAPPINPNMPLLADKILWSSSCPQCEYELQDSVGNAESLAASLLSARHKLLKIISFGSFLSPGRAEPSEWTVLRKCKGDRLLVSVVGRSSSRSYQYEFERLGSGDHWALVTI